MQDGTIEILKRFDDSWAAVENVYTDLIQNYPGFERLIPIKQFMDDLKQMGENKYFRLGMS